MPEGMAKLHRFPVPICAKRSFTLAKTPAELSSIAAPRHEHDRERGSGDRADQQSRSRAGPVRTSTWAARSVSEEANEAAA